MQVRVNQQFFSDNLVLSTVLIVWIGHRKEIPKGICSDEGLSLETSAFESLYGGQFTLSTQLKNQIILLYFPPMQHHSFCRNVPPLVLLRTILMVMITPDNYM